MKSNYFRTTYLHRGLKRQLARSQKELQQTGSAHCYEQLVVVAAGMVFVAALLALLGGYHAGFHSLNQWVPILPNSFWSIVTFVGDTHLAVALMLFFARRNPAALWVVLITAVLGLLVTHGLKNSIALDRPPAILAPEAFHLIGQGFHRSSFPSGHSFTAFSMITILYYFANQLHVRLSLLALGLTIAVSRVMVGAHWPVDILVGGALGILTSLAAFELAKRWQWGLTVPMHLFTLSLHLIATFTLFVNYGGYPDAQWFAYCVAVASLAFFISEYFITPYGRSPKWVLQWIN